MIIPETFEEKTGFAVVRQMLKNYCLGTGGKLLVDEIAFTIDYEVLNDELSLTEEFRLMLLSVFGYPASEYHKLDDELNTVQVSGTFIQAEVLLLLRNSYSVYCDSVSFISHLKGEIFPLLLKLVSPHPVNAAIISLIDKVIDHDAQIRDNASAELLQLRKELASAQRSIDKKIAQALSYAKAEKIVPADTEISVRDGRAVIPVIAANKRKISGVVIDESATGQTAYIEPTEVFELRNRIKELELAEKREIIKILIALTDNLRPDIHHIKTSLEFNSRLDVLRAKALFAIETGSLKPELLNQPVINWIQARHPLLLLSLKKQKRELVPSDIALSQTNRILIISGPNAGGKSVLLKTCGLLQYMLQCGLLIPVLDTSIAGIFKNIFIDIGDQQSIENDLSTYSSHLFNIRRLLELADTHTLFMIDEFGAGTEPQSGGAIAEAILESLNQKGAWGVVTTHYANLKLLASEHQGFVNGAMLYDTRQMRPLFLLRTGRPGSSFAFEIAANIQLPAEILNSAADKIGRGKLDFDKQMQDFEAEKLALNLKEKQLEQADEMLSSLINKYTGLSRDLERRQKEIIESANSEAKNIIKNSNRLIENTIREIKQTNAESNRTKELRKAVADYAETIDKPLEISSLPEVPPIVEPEPKLSGTIAVGRRVRLIGQHESGEVAEINGNEVTIAFNTFSLKADISTLELLQDKKPVAKTVNRGIAYQNMVNDMNARLANFRIKIDVRGKRAEETEPIIQKYVDEAAMLHIREISILHGKGNGVLRSVIRNILQAHPEVKSFSDAPLETGGAGITMVTLK